MKKTIIKEISGEFDSDFDIKEFINLPVEKLHRALKKLRKTKWGYFRELSQRSGVNSKTISSILLGRTKFVKFKTWEKLANAEERLPKPMVELIKDDEQIELSKRQKAILDGYDSLSTDRKLRFLEYLEMMISAQEQEDSK